VLWGSTSSTKYLRRESCWIDVLLVVNTPIIPHQKILAEVEGCIESQLLCWSLHCSLASVWWYWIWLYNEMLRDIMKWYWTSSFCVIKVYVSVYVNKKIYSIYTFYLVQLHTMLLWLLHDHSFFHRSLGKLISTNLWTPKLWKNNVMYKLSPKNVGLFPSPKVEGNVGFNGS